MKKVTKTGIYTNKHYLSYLATQQLTTKPAKEILVKLTKFIKLKGPVCDLGSGSGFFLKACEEMGLKAVGIEGCKAAVDWSNKNSVNKTIHRDLNKNLPFKSEAFQAVYCNSVLEHLPPRAAEKTIAEAYRILQIKGLFVCACPNFFDFAERFSEHINLYTPTRLRQSLINHHFKVIYEHLCFNLSLLTPWEDFKEGGKTGNVRKIVKKNTTLINIFFSPVWLPIRLANKYIFHWQLLDILAGSCFFIAQKY